MWTDFRLPGTKTSAQIAKERLQYVISIDRANNCYPEYKPGNHRIFGEEITVCPGDIVIPYYNPASGNSAVVIVPGCST